MSARLDGATVRALVEGRHGDPFAVLGPHEGVVRTLQPGADAVDLVDEHGNATSLRRVADEGLFEGDLPDTTANYTLRIAWPGATQDTRDPYSFGPQLGDLDLHLIGEGRHHALADALGALETSDDGIAGTRFAVWAPNASQVSVIGDFNSWDRRRHPMRLRHGAGVWELFIPGVHAGARYKFSLRDARGHRLPDKADPVARQAELAPATASIVASRRDYAWNDAEWMASRAARHAIDAPIRIYEMHAASWMQRDGKPLDWDALADRLLPYVTEMGFSHIELLPISEHPFSGSWGYQPLGLFAPTARHGTPEQFARFVDRCHRMSIGVIVDWVPAHFPTDAHGLAQFDGTALYEHADPREGFHQDWNTLIYNHGRNEVRGFLIASALEWLKRYHVDGLRVDAVASMLYRDYSRRAGEWIPNVHGGRENYESIDFLRQLNAIVHAEAKGAIVIAEESTAWPGVTAPPERGGLGFDYKWNMGWMHDTLEYVSRDPVHRRWHHSEMTFGLLYAFSEHFVLPLSHDEVVHGKRSLLGRMPGDEWRRFAILRAYFAFMWTHPGKKLLFMGGEFAQGTEWNHDASPPWHLLDNPMHRGVQRLVRDLNFLYERRRALHAGDSDPAGFAWIVGDDAANSVYAFLRRAGDDEVLVVVNFTPEAHRDYRVGVPAAGAWRELINTDARDYGGSGVGNEGRRATDAVAAHGYAQSLALTLPPLGAVVLALRETD